MGPLGLRKTQLRYTHKLRDGLKLTAAIIEPVGGNHGADADGDSLDDAGDSSFPPISVKLVYTAPLFPDMPATFGIAGVYDREDINEQLYDSWAVIGSATLP
jgi:hypothetical protein